VKCFRNQQTLSLSQNQLPARWTILIGDNGTGKTTLLRLIALMRPVPIPIPSEKRRKDTMPAWALESSMRLRALDMVEYERHARVQLRASDSCVLNAASIDDYTFRMELFNTATVQSSSGHDVTEARSVVFGYGFNRRLQSNAPLVSPDEAQSEVASLFDANAPLIPAEEWYLQRDYATFRLPEGSVEREQARVERARIEGVLLALLPEISRLEVVVPDPKAGGAQLHAHTRYGRVRITELGQGYQSTLAWVVDLAARMSAAYPASANPLAEPAVVLVDEIDLHLHPRWQRSLLAQLTEQFPNVQWIVTAHSPLIVQNTPNATNIAVLRREGDQVVIDNSPQSVRDWRLDQILTSDLFGIPSARAKTFDEHIERRDALLEKSRRTPEEEHELDELDQKLAGFTFGEGRLEMEVNRVLNDAAKAKVSQ
jgi:recombinational DNA repair ATPase RecF